MIFKSLFQKFSLLDLQNVYVCALESIQHLNFRFGIETKTQFWQKGIIIHYEKKFTKTF